MNKWNSSKLRWPNFNNLSKNQNEALHWKRHITVLQISFYRIGFNFMRVYTNGLKTHLSPCQQLDQDFNTKDIILSWTSLVFQWVLQPAGKLFNFLTAVVLMQWKLYFTGSKIYVKPVMLSVVVFPFRSKGRGAEALSSAHFLKICCNSLYYN